MTRKKHHWLQPKPYLWVRIGVGRVQMDLETHRWYATRRNGPVNERLGADFPTAYAAKQHLDRLAEREASR